MKMTVVQYHPVLLHGSHRTDIQRLDPRAQTDYGGNPISAVFASGDGIWPMFFALIESQQFIGSMRNGCFVTIQNERYYFFSVNAIWLAKQLWSPGAIYILPKDGFRQSDTNGIRFDEWINESPIRPLMKLAIEPQDFPFLSQVAGHDEEESIFESWLRYKERISA